jgi:hypothetical protein
MTKAEYARLEDVAWSEYAQVARAALAERERAIALAKAEGFEFDQMADGIMAEREACAKIVKGQADYWRSLQSRDGSQFYLNEVASLEIVSAEIRSRK